MKRQCTPRPSLDLLRGFRAASRHLSFTRAAQELFVTQSAISHEIRTLEQQLGRPLFRRVNRTLQLTETGEQLFRAIDEGLTLIDDAIERAAGPTRTLSVTTTVALASTWLVPRLPGFAARNPDIDLRVVSTNEWLDLKREHIDVALRFVLNNAAQPALPKLFTYRQFPVCSPALARKRLNPLRSSADLARHVLIDFEAIVYRRPWYDWQHWFGAMRIRPIKGAGWLRFSHYDQVIEAARRGSGIAVGKLPHLASHLREGVLVSPLGDAGVADVGAFYLEVADSAPKQSVDVFTDWMREEIRRDDDETLKRSAAPARTTRRDGTRTTARPLRR